MLPALLVIVPTWAQNAKPEMAQKAGLESVQDDQGASDWEQDLADKTTPRPLSRLEQAKKELASASAQSSSALKHGQQIVAELQKLADDFEARSKDRNLPPLMLRKAEEEADANAESQRFQLQRSFTLSLEALQQLENVTRTELEIAAEKVERASKDLRKLEKSKVKEMRKMPHMLMKAAKKNAKQLEKQAQKSAHASLRWAHNAEAAGRKAGQDESAYEGAYEAAEHISENLDREAEHYAERAEGYAERFYEGAEGTFERRSDEIMDAAEEAHEKRMQQLAQALEKVTVQQDGAYTNFLATSQVQNSVMPLCLMLTAMAALGVMKMRRPARSILNKPILG